MKRVTSALKGQYGGFQPLLNNFANVYGWEGVVFYSHAWLQELEVALSALDDCALECDGVTYAISKTLEKADIGHVAFCGFARDTTTGNIVMPHCWVELQGGVMIDFRLRMWLGDSEDIPHGVFLRSSQPRFIYQGLPIRPEMDWDELVQMTEGRIEEVRIPPITYLQ